MQEKPYMFKGQVYSLKTPSDITLLGRTSEEVFGAVDLHFISDLHFVFVVSSFHFWSLFCWCCSSFINALHSYFLFDIISHPSVDYRRVFTPILYFQPSPSQALFTLRSFTDILPAIIKASLWAGRSSLKFAGLHTDPRNTDPTHLFVWFTVSHKLHNQSDLYLSSTIY